MWRFLWWHGEVAESPERRSGSPDSRVTVGIVVRRGDGGAELAVRATLWAKRLRDSTSTNLCKYFPVHHVSRRPEGAAPTCRERSKTRENPGRQNKQHRSSARSASRIAQEANMQSTRQGKTHSSKAEPAPALHCARVPHPSATSLPPCMFL